MACSKHTLLYSIIHCRMVVGVIFHLVSKVRKVYEELLTRSRDTVNHKITCYCLPQMKNILVFSKVHLGERVLP